MKKALIVTAKSLPDGDVEMAVYCPGYEERFVLNRTAAAGMVRDISAALANLPVDRASETDKSDG